MLLLCFVLMFIVNLFPEAALVKTCGPTEFPCNDGSCVEKGRWCDAKIDCDDDSDENYCFYRTTSIKNANGCNETLFFVCDDGRCIPAIGRCDGFSSCFDNSDEENCDAAENTSDVSDDSTKLLIKADAEVPSIWLNRNESKTSGKLYDHENSMQADHVPHTDISAVNKSVSYSVSGSNTSEHFQSSLNLKQTDQHKASIVNIKRDVGNYVSENVTNEGGYKPLVQKQEALKFRDLLLNASRNEQNVTKSPVNFDIVQNSTSPNKSLNLKPDAGGKQTLENPNSQSNVSQHSKMHADGDSVSAQKIASKEEDLYKGYVELRTKSFRNAKERALHWLIDSRDSDYGWGEETARGMIAVRMADYSSGKPGDIQLMSKQLHLKIFTLMSRNETKRIPLGDLALYINALSASCDNPKNFHGYDLINILRHRTNDAQESSKFVTPFVYLVLCLHNASSYADLVQLRDMLNDWNNTRIDTEAIISLAVTCISRTPKFSSVGIGHIAARRLYDKITARGLPANIYELALLTQALNEARINQDLWNRTEAMHRITKSQNKDGSFGDILSTYYAVPTLSGRSFLWICNVCPGKEGLDPVEVLQNGKDEKMYFHYTLRFGNPIEMSQAIVIRVQKDANFMDIMRIAATVNPIYKFKYDMNEGKPTVYSIGGRANDAERGLYWTPYTTRNSTKELVPFEGDIQNFIPVLGEHIAFWWKPMV